MVRRLSLLLALAGAPVWAQAPVEDAPPARTVTEPNVRVTVIEDGATRIEELRVRGQLLRIHVTPRGGGAGYEIIPPHGARSAQDRAEDHSGQGGAAGKRVWRVLAF